MEAKELRIGNLVKYRWAIIKVKSLDLDGINLKHDYNKYACQDQVIARIRFRNNLLQPIPLTEEILLKCGFEDKTYQSGYIGKEFRSNMILDFVLTKPKKLYETQYYYVFELREHRIVPIQYLHQLQNFYFSITQQELEINLQ